MSRKSITIISLLVVLLTVWMPGSSSAGPPGDDALRRHPGFAEFMERYPQDWEQRLHPTTRRIATWQRIVDSHALILGLADEEPNPQYTTPRVGIFVANWDHTDLFALGIPKVYNSKPVEIIDGGFPKLSGMPESPLIAPLRVPLSVSMCDKERPARGGLSVGNRTRWLPGTFEGGTLGGAVFGLGWPTNAGWKYLVSCQHVLLTERWVGQGGDQINQPMPGCLNSEWIGNVINPFPEHLKVRHNNADNPNTQDSAVASLRYHSILRAEIRGIGTPTGQYDPPQNGWCGNISGAISGVKGGCIYWYPQTILMGDMWFDDVFISVGGQNGDSSALWLDYDRRVHGMLFAYYYDDWAFYMRWQHVANAWTIDIATHD